MKLLAGCSSSYERERFKTCLKELIVFPFFFFIVSKLSLFRRWEKRKSDPIGRKRGNPKKSRDGRSWQKNHLSDESDRNQLSKQSSLARSPARSSKKKKKDAFAFTERMLNFCFLAFPLKDSPARQAGGLCYTKSTRASLPLKKDEIDFFIDQQKPSLFLGREKEEKGKRKKRVSFCFAQLWSSEKRKTFFFLSFSAISFFVFFR